MSNAILLISCPDKKGITASVTNFVFKNNGNIIHADQHIDEQSNIFFMRIEWSLKGFSIKKNKIAVEFEKIANKFQMAWDIAFDDYRPKIVIFTSKHLHCLRDILVRYKTGQLNCDISAIISNHSDAKKLSQESQINFFKMSITSKNKESQEKRQIKILREMQIDCVILARYHQFLTRQFIEAFSNKIINIHHSFLPAFAGKSPYLRAYKKGVKIIGATSHYVTEKLDEGPIIAQDTVRISHRDSLSDLIRKGEDLEKAVLNRAVRLHLEKKLLCYNNKTVVFD